MAKNIAIFTTSYLPIQGGVQYLLYWLLSEIDNNYNYYQDKYNFDNFYFISPNLHKNEHAKFYNIKLIETVSIDTKLNKIRCIWQILSYVKYYKINLIHAQNAYFDSLCCNFAKRFSNMHYIVTSHGEDVAHMKEFNYGGVLGLNAKRIIKNNLSNANLITTISQDMCEFIYEIAPKEKVILIPNSLPYVEEKIDQELLNERIKSLKSKYFLDDNSIVCLSLSGAREIKGHKNMILGFNNSYKKNQNLRLFIAAHGELTESLNLLVKQLKLDEVIHFVGFITGATKEAFFNISNVYVNTAYFEPFGLVYLESIKQNIVNLASNRGGGKDIFTHKKNAYLINPHSIEEISNGFIYLCNSRVRNELIKASQKLLPRYQTNKIVEEYFEIYMKAI